MKSSKTSFFAIFKIQILRFFQIYVINSYNSGWNHAYWFMVYDSKISTIKEVRYQNNSKVEYAFAFMLDSPPYVCTVSIPQLNSFVIAGGYSSS